MLPMVTHCKKNSLYFCSMLLKSGRKLNFLFEKVLFEKCKVLYEKCKVLYEKCKVLYEK